jgi:hypothetical protein
MAMRAGNAIAQGPQRGQSSGLESISSHTGRNLASVLSPDNSDLASCCDAPVIRLDNA